MSLITEKIYDVILNNSNLIDEKITGINYLEKLKYLIINDLQLLNFDNLNIELENIENHSKKFEIKERPLTFSIKLYKSSQSKIKLANNEDNLCIVLAGFKKVIIFDFLENTKSTSLSIIKNMGLVLSKKTIISENIGADSIILDILFKIEPLNIEN